MSIIALASVYSRTASPIGPIPLDFYRMSDLCHAAHIRYDDKDIKQKDGTFTQHRVWRVVTDEVNPGKNPTMIQFKKFCMLLDWLMWKNPTLSRRELLEAAIVPQSRAESWQDMNDRLAKEGVQGYDTLRRKAKGKSQENVDAFDE